MNVKTKLKYIIVFFSILCVSYLVAAYYKIFKNIFGQAVDSGHAITIMGSKNVHAYDNFFFLFTWYFRTIALCLTGYALFRFMLSLKNILPQLVKPQNDKQLVIARPFGGWLILLAFSLIISSVLSPFVYYQFFDLFQSVSSNAVKRVLVFELILGLFAFLFLLLVLISFLQKHKNTPRLLKVLLMFNIFAAFFLFLVSLGSDSNQLRDIYVLALFKNGLSALIVISYLSYSKRVKETFVNE